MRIYLLSFNDNLGSREKVTAFLDTRTEVADWIAFLPHTIGFTSDYTADQLLEIFEDEYPKGWFFISEIIMDNSNGLLGKDVWKFLNKANSPAPPRFPRLRPRIKQ
jgi:hypothetical protein